MSEAKPTSPYPRRGEHVVYWFYDAYGAILYIGVTMKFPDRMKQHHRSQPWIAEVETMSWHAYGSREAAVAAEAACIDAQNPKYNIARGVPYHDVLAEAFASERYQALREWDLSLEVG